MATDTKGLTPDLVGKKLRMYFEGGEIADVVLLSFDIHEDCEFGDRYAGFCYDVVSTNQPDRYRKDENKKPRPVYAADFKLLERWQFADSTGGQ